MHVCAVVSLEKYEEGADFFKGKCEALRSFYDSSDFPVGP
jgi:hypothetical protein